MQPYGQRPNPGARGVGGKGSGVACQWRSRMFNRRKHGLCRSSEPGHEDQELQMSIERMELR